MIVKKTRKEKEQLKIIHVLKNVNLFPLFPYYIQQHYIIISSIKKIYLGIKFFLNPHKYNGTRAPRDAPVRPLGQRRT